MARRLLLLNGVAIVCVILFHATGFGFTAMFSWPHRYRHVSSPNYDQIGTTAYYALRLVEQMVVFAIPAFLFVSGFFISVLTGRNRATVDSGAIGARIKSLVIPYLLWSGIALLAIALQGRVLSGPRYLSAILTGSANPNYYYVPLLVQLYLLSPLIVLLAKWKWKLLLATTAIVQIFVYSLQYVVVLGLDIPVVSSMAAALPKWLFLAHLFWFTFGVVAGFQHQALKLVLERTKWILLPSLVGLFLVGVVEWELLLHWSGTPWSENRVTLIDGLYSGALILSFLAYADVRLPFSSSLLALGSRSYGIYLAHGLVMEFLARGLYHFAPWILGQQVLFQPILIVVGLLVPITLMSVVSRSPSRGLYGYVFG
jgi:surface polysaccharide O-acyltransferase-like enzyme